MEELEDVEQLQISELFLINEKALKRLNEEFDLSNNLDKYRIKNMITSLYLYDERNDKIYTQFEYGERWTIYKFNDCHKLTYFEDKHGLIVRREYDDKGRQIYKYTDDKSIWTRTEWDDEGNKIYEEDEEGILIDEREEE